MTSQTTASLQNQVRIRIFLTLLLSAFVRLLRTYASASVQNATAITELSYFLYLFILICSMLPFRASWMVSLVAAMTVAGFGGSFVILGTISTIRCVSAMHAGCIQDLPSSAVTLLFGLLIVLVDVYQCWTIYLILRYPSFVSHGLRRIRVLFAWAAPFGWLVSGILFYNSSWSFLFSAHLIGDPTLIILAGTDETLLIWILLVALVFSDVLAFLSLDRTRLDGGSLLRICIIVQFIFTFSSMAMLIFGESAPKVMGVTAKPIANAKDRGEQIPAESQLRHRPVTVKHSHEKILQKSLKKKIAF